MGILVDTGVFIVGERNPERLGDVLAQVGAEGAWISVITASELLHGVHRAVENSVQARREAFVETILARVPILGIDLSLARVHARIWAELVRQGTMIGLHDSWIAATCLAHDLSLLTTNLREFSRISALKIINLRTNM
ncbi:MAG: PIN domain-containing protein [Pirellulales bacterium]|nr:PIN domain-containing protein [Pirellulales bacterium]